MENKKPPLDQKLCSGCEEPAIDKLPACPLQCRATQCKAYQTKSKFDPETKPIVWVLGGPGSGKFTQCSKVVETYGYTHLSTGDLIRDEVKTGTRRGKCLTSIMQRGGLVPNDMVLAVLKDAMEDAAKKGTHGYLIDGFPREKSQGAEFERTIGPVALILYFEASPNTLCRRLLGRAEASTEDNRRKDDKFRIMKMRIATFIEHNHSVLEPYGSKVKRIDAEQSPDDIFAEVQLYLEPIVAHAALVEAEKLEAEALEKIRAVRAFTQSSIDVASRRKESTVNDDVVFSATSEAAEAEARARAARNAAEAARSRLEELEQRQRQRQ
ncbi:adenylate kinase isoenzyme 1-like isoform X1 [Spodoptera litura]|uniref:Adenylate kinase isoenzyme 1-like isoform X1 n=1 Tax=Spodoptera litura TaxID=69820 RepID=A0A9J7E3K4_SPOLT|nr:adenylate kinase isoenzyme 1-like isoform X1 [Spodoptera litura]